MRRITRGKILVGNTSITGTSGSLDISGAVTFLKGTTSWNVGTVADGTINSTAFALTGATTSSACLVAPGFDLQECTVTATCPAAGTVEIVVNNETGASIILGTAAATWTVFALK